MTSKYNTEGNDFYIGLSDALYDELPDKPPLLSEQEIVDYSVKDCEYCELAVEIGKWASKVQREMDIKYYTKEIKD